MAEEIKKKDKKGYGNEYRNDEYRNGKNNRYEKGKGLDKVIDKGLTNKTNADRTKQDNNRADKIETVVNTRNKSVADKSKIFNSKLNYAGSVKFKTEETKMNSSKSNRKNSDKDRTDKIEIDRDRVDKIRGNKGRTDNVRTDKVRTDKIRTDNARTDKIKAVNKPWEKKTSVNNEIECPYIRKCGGCQLMNLSYDKQLKTKQKQVDELLKKFAKVEPILGMKNPYYYRNKVHAVFDRDRRGNPISGVYEAGSHIVVPIENCLIEDKKAGEIIISIRDMLRSFKIKTYDEDTDYGLLRHVLIRKGFHSGEIMVVLVIASPIFPSKNNFVKALLKQHPEITTIIVNVNSKKTSLILGDKEQVLYGKGYIEDTLCGKRFRISAKSFYQVNPVQTEILYKKAIELAGLTGKETILDAYCGIGTIGLIASDYVNKVIGVELNKDAIRDAVMNAKLNEIKNAEFYNNDAGEFLNQMVTHNQTVDVVFMDPPRAGSDERFINAVCSMAPKKILYISCNPETLARDLGLLSKSYKVERIIPVDMFPGTEHVETIVKLEKR